MVLLELACGELNIAVTFLVCVSVRLAFRFGSLGQNFIMGLFGSNLAMDWWILK